MPGAALAILRAARAGETDAAGKTPSARALCCFRATGLSPLLREPGH
jgi:hypothetical protein